MACSETPIVLQQVHYNLKVREAERAGMPEFCRRHDIVLQAWRPVRDVTSSPLTGELERKYQLSLAGLALAWLLNQPGISTISAMKTPSHLSENLQALSIQLSIEDRERLRNEYPGQVFQSPAVPLI